MNLAYKILFLFHATCLAVSPLFGAECFTVAELAEAERLVGQLTIRTITELPARYSLSFQDIDADFSDSEDKKLTYEELIFDDLETLTTQKSFNLHAIIQQLNAEPLGHFQSKVEKWHHYFPGVFWTLFTSNVITSLDVEKQAIIASYPIPQAQPKISTSPVKKKSPSSKSSSSSSGVSLSPDKEPTAITDFCDKHFSENLFASADARSALKEAVIAATAYSNSEFNAFAPQHIRLCTIDLVLRAIKYLATGKQGESVDVKTPKHKAGLTKIKQFLAAQKGNDLIARTTQARIQEAELQAQLAKAASAEIEKTKAAERAAREKSEEKMLAGPAKVQPPAFFEKTKKAIIELCTLIDQLSAESRTRLAQELKQNSPEKIARSIHSYGETAVEIARLSLTPSMAKKILLKIDREFSCTNPLTQGVLGISQLEMLTILDRNNICELLCAVFQLFFVESKLIPDPNLRLEFFNVVQDFFIPYATFLATLEGLPEDFTSKVTQFATLAVQDITLLKRQGACLLTAPTQLSLEESFAQIMGIMQRNPSTHILSASQDDDDALIDPSSCESPMLEAPAVIAQFPAIEERFAAITDFLLGQDPRLHHIKSDCSVEMSLYLIIGIFAPDNIHYEKFWAELDGEKTHTFFDLITSYFESVLHEIEQHPSQYISLCSTLSHCANCTTGEIKKRNVREMVILRDRLGCLGIRMISYLAHF